MSKLTVQDLDQLRQEGHVIVELPGNLADVDGNRFRIIGQRALPVDNASVVAESDQVHFPAGGNVGAVDVGNGVSLVAESQQVHGDF